MEKDKITTEIKKAQEQVKPSTSLAGEMVLNALENQYISGYPKPDFSYSEAYKELEKAASECESSFKLQQIIKKKLKIQRTGTISKEEQTRIFNEVCDLPLKDLLSEHKKYLMEVERLKKSYDGLVSSDFKNTLDFQKKRNEILIGLWESQVYAHIYSCAIDLYVKDNQDLIQEEIDNIKRTEIRGSISNLVDYLNQ